MNRSILHKQDGAALVIAICVISVMVIMAIAVTAMALDTNKTTSHDIWQTQGVNVAEAGIEDAVALSVANYNTMFPNGSYTGWQSSQQHPDGPAVFTEKQVMNDSSGKAVGNYHVYLKPDPTGQGDVVFTSKGVVNDSPNTKAVTVTVRVSVKYSPSPPPAFDYALMLGDKNHQPQQMQMQANGKKSDFYGKVQINAGQMQGQDENFLSRDGYSDTVGYTGTIQCQCGGNAPFVKGAGPDFPTIDLSAFNNNTNPNNVYTETLPSSGAPSGGWSRSGNTFSISAANFENKYKNYNIVKLVSQTNGVTVNITGSGTIGETVLVPGTPGTGVNINYLKFTGPNLILQPKNGLAILTLEGFVDFINGVQVGSPGNGALVFMSSQNSNGTNDQGQFELQGNMTVYGSVLYQTQVQQGQFQSNGTGDMSIIYDGAFKNNPNLPAAWGNTGTVTATKINYSQDPN